MSAEISLAMNSFACGMLSMAFFISTRWWAWLGVVPVFTVNAGFVALFFWGAA
jgi:hypothetical protein